jgi:poly(A) polymerase
MLTQAESEALPSDAAFAAADRVLADAPELKLPISGADLIARGAAAGRPVGQALRAFQALWIRAGFPTEPETLTRLLEEAVTESTRPEPSTQEALEPRSI